MSDAESRTIFVVVDENTLGYIDPKQPDIIGILHASPIRGGSAMVRRDDDGWFYRPMNDKGMRPARLADFDEYRCSTDGYINNPRYDMPKE